MGCLLLIPPNPACQFPKQRSLCFNLKTLFSSETFLCFASLKSHSEEAKPADKTRAFYLTEHDDCFQLHSLSSPAHLYVGMGQMRMTDEYHVTWTWQELLTPGSAPGFRSHWIKRGQGWMAGNNWTQNWAKLASFILLCPKHCCPY